MVIDLTDLICKKNVAYITTANNNIMSVSRFVHIAYQINGKCPIEKARPI